MTVRIEKPAVNLREELADLRKPTGIAGEAMLRAETPQEQQALIGVGRRNLIINGDFQVWQRGTSFTNTGQTFTADRWRAGAGTITKDSLAIKYTASNTDPYLSYRIEDIDNRLAGKDAVFSFYLKTSNGLNEFQYLTFCNTNYQLNSMYKIPSEIDGYTRWVCPVKITNYNPGEIQFVIELETVIGSISYLRQVQLELGKVATPFEHRSYGEELALCQRYFCKTYSDGTAIGTATSTGAIMSVAYGTISYASAGTWQFPVEMRAAPTVTLYSTANANTTGKVTADSTDGAGVASSISTNSAVIYRGNDSTGVSASVFIKAQATANAEL